MSNTLDRLRAKRAELGTVKTITREIPGYEGDLAVRFVWKPYEELASKGQALAKIKSPTRQSLLAAVDTLVTLCQEVVIRPDDKDDPRIGEDGYVPLATDEDPEPVRFAADERLADALGFTSKGKDHTARDDVFGTYVNDYAILNEAMELSTWLQDTTREVDTAFSGS